jgi:hypothetical protein
MNPLRFIADRCIDFRQLADLVRGSSVDLAETLDISTSLLTAILSSSIGKDPTANAANETHGFNALLKAKEAEFLPKTDFLLATISDRIEQLQAGVSNLDELTQKQDEETIKMFRQKSGEFSLANTEVLFGQKAEFKDVEERLLTRQRQVCGEYERTLACRLAEISQSYAAKLNETDVDIEQQQTKLQNLIHGKHEQKKAKGDDAEAERRRFALEHERLSREHKQKQKEQTAAIADLETTLQEYRAIAERDAKDSNQKVVRLEATLRAEQQLEIDGLRNDIGGLDADAGKLTEKLKGVQAARAELDLARAATIQVEIDRLLDRISAERLATDRLVKEQTEGLSREAEQQIERVKGEIENAKRDHFLLMKTSARDGENRMRLQERDEEKVMVQFEEQLYKLRKELLDAKNRLKQAENDRERGIGEARNRLNLNYGSALGAKEDAERSHIEQVNDLMRHFEEEQRRLADLHSVTVQQHDKQRADAIAKLRAEHEARKEKVIKDAEQKVLDEVAARLRAEEESENAHHAEQISMIQSRISEVRARMASITEESAKFEEQNRATMETIETTDEKLSHAQHARSIVLKDMQDASDAIRRVHEDFVSKLGRFESLFGATRQHLCNEVYDKETQVNRLEKQVSLQQRRIQDLETMETERQEEVQTFEQGMAKETQMYEQTTKKIWESSLGLAREKPEQVINMMTELKDHATSEIASLQQRLTAAKEYTDSLSRIAMIERDHTTEELRLTLKLQYEERTNVLNQRHADVMKRLKKGRKEMRNDHELRMIDVDRKVQEQQMQNRRDFEDGLAFLLAEKEKLTDEAEQLTERLDNLIAAGCKGCHGKKEAIRLLLERKKELQERMDTLLVDVQDKEEQLLSMMAVQRPQVVSPNLELVRTSLGRRPTKVAPPRTHSSLASRSWQRRLSPR